MLQSAWLGTTDFRETAEFIDDDSDEDADDGVEVPEMSKRDGVSEAADTMTTATPTTSSPSRAPIPPGISSMLRISGGASGGEDILIRAHSVPAGIGMQRGGGYGSSGPKFAGGAAARSRPAWADLRDDVPGLCTDVSEDEGGRVVSRLNSLGVCRRLSQSNNFPVHEQTPARASASAAARVGECLPVSVAIHRAGGICYSDAAVSDAVYRRLELGPAVSGDCVCPPPPFTFQEYCAVSKAAETSTHVRTHAIVRAW